MFCADPIISALYMLRLFPDPVIELCQRSEVKNSLRLINFEKFASYQASLIRWIPFSSRWLSVRELVGIRLNYLADRRVVAV